MFRFTCFTLLLVVAAVFSSAAAQSRKPDSDQGKKLDLQSSRGDVHLGTDATAEKAGLPLYPGARLRRDEDSNNTLNVGVLTEAFGIKLVVAKYDSDDAPGKVIEYYREALKKYGKVLECHTRDHGGRTNAEVDDDSDSKSNALKCEGDNSGPVTELKVGTQNNQHVVAIEPGQSPNGSTFAIVYVRARGKQGDL